MATHGRGGRGGKGKERKRRGEEDYWDMAYIRFSNPSRDGRKRGEAVEKEDSSAGLTCEYWTCAAFLLYPSLR